MNPKTTLDQGPWILEPGTYYVPHGTSMEHAVWMAEIAQQCMDRGCPPESIGIDICGNRTTWN